MENNGSQVQNITWPSCYAPRAHVENSNYLKGNLNYLEKSKCEMYGRMDGWRDAQTWVKLIIHLPPSTSSGESVKKLQA